MTLTRHIRRLTRLTLASSFVMLGVSLTSAPASAETTKTKTWHTDATTIGSSSICRATADGTQECTSHTVILLGGTKDQDDARACLSANSWTQLADGTRLYGPYEFGCTPIDRQSFAIDKHLDGAFLEPVTVVLEDPLAATSRSVTVAATWRGYGDSIGDEYDYHQKNGPCHVNSDYEYERREATGSMTISGVEHSFDWASMLVSESKLHVRCELSE